MCEFKLLEKYIYLDKTICSSTLSWINRFQPLLKINSSILFCKQSKRKYKMMTWLLYVQFGKKMQTVFFFEVLFFKMTLALSLFFILWNSIILFKIWITFLEEKISKGAHLGVAGVHLQLRFFCPTPSWKKYPSQKLICIPHHLPNVGCFFLPLPLQVL